MAVHPFDPSACTYCGTRHEAGVYCAELVDAERWEEEDLIRRLADMVHRFIPYAPTEEHKVEARKLISEVEERGK